MASQNFYSVANSKLVTLYYFSHSLANNMTEIRSLQDVLLISLDLHGARDGDRLLGNVFICPMIYRILSKIWHSNLKNNY